ncbi:sulfatase-like hydrolase/transferase [Echinimonas agarilytica]|uniref:Sulfatase-like hydrolase/transferase n=1 Tax=Echinimonas agarilytica TaxID=1215918 RepID=A0AA41W6N0_9GAMM|nr:sulfatase-like hydrolase/transferase [Echinimonas agarilytica]MCM2679636.1 sulfatase-like hydrolase/transferase [Echinimonas agarilytica]
MKFIWLTVIISTLSTCSSAEKLKKNVHSDISNTDKPNVIFIFIDDMGFADISAFGNQKLKTPNIDRLAEEGLKFTNFYVNSPICSASRVALKTGLYPQRSGIHSFLSTRKHNKSRQMPDFLSAEYFTYAKLLKSSGYVTAHYGKWHIGGGRDVNNAPLPQSYGYDESLVSFEGLGDRILWSKTGNQTLSWQHGQGEILDLPKHKTTETYIDYAIRFIIKNKDKPFLLNLFPNDVHDGHNPSSLQLAKWKGQGRHEYDAKFFAVLDEMDNQIGRLLDALGALKLSDNTVVMLTSDNGPTDWKRYYDENIEPPGFTGPYRGRKWSLYEGGTRMPFIIRWPAQIKPKTENNTSILSAIDILPSLAGLLDLELPQNVSVDGKDMSSTFLGKKISRNQPLFWEYGVKGSIKPGKASHVSPPLAMRDGDWKLLMSVDATHVELYNLVEDKSEQHNLANQHPKKVEEMKSQLLAWWQDVAHNSKLPSKR